MPHLIKNQSCVISLIICIAPIIAQSEEIYSGTGFFINDRGAIVTNAHVVRGCKSIAVKSRDLGVYSAALITLDIKNDLAILKLEKFTQKSPHPALNYRARLGESAYVFGYPLTGVLSDTGNFTSGSVTSLQGIGNDSSKLQISTPVQPGNSGGPVLDDKGNLIGIVVSKLDALKNIAVTKDIAQNVNFAIKSQVLDGVLQAVSITTSMQAETQIKQAVDIAEIAQSIAVHIMCKTDNSDKSKQSAEKAEKIPDSSNREKNSVKQKFPVQLGSFGEWGAYAVDSAKGRVCYILAQPKERAPVGIARDAGFLSISTRPAEKVYNEMSIILGFPSADGSIGELTIGNSSFQLISKGNSAWLKNISEEKNVIELMKNNSIMKTKTVSLKGNVTYDTYLLSGMNRAMDMIRKSCP
jgi:hypothetical protein